jgi:hypothetical protein
VALGGALAFYKVNNKPFINVLEAFFKYTLGGKLYIWRKEEKAPKELEKKAPATPSYIPKLADSKLKDMAWSLDVKENANPTTAPENKVKGDR